MKSAISHNNIFTSSFLRMFLSGGLLLGILVFSSCRKKELMPVPEGKPFPYTDSLELPLKEVLKASPYKLFYAAWQRSHMDSLLAATGEHAQFTLLAPDDAAMQAAGLNAAAIESRTPEELDTLLLYHVIAERVEPTAMMSQVSNIGRRSMLKHPFLNENINGTGSSIPTTVPYQYRHYMGIANGSLVINGVSVGNATPVAATNGILWPVNQVLQKPEKNILDVLKEDRFSMYLEINRINDSILLEIGYGIYVRGVMDKFSPDIYDHTGFTSVFAPTDEAFHNAGINSMDDLVAMNARAMPYLDVNTFLLSNQFVTDSLLNYHVWGFMYAPVAPYGSPAVNPVVFYSNDLRNDFLSNYVLSTPGYNVPAYYVPLDFMKEGNGPIRLQVKGSEFEPATITTPDINTLQGPVHVVDHLLIPKGFILK